MANVTARGVTRYRFDAKASFSYRRDEWLARVASDQAVAYEVIPAENCRGH
jgi:hypothetical protein